MKKVVVFLCVLFLTFLSVNASYAGKGCKDKTGDSGFFPYLTIDSGGIERSYMLYVPAGLNKNKPTPLVLNFHGLGLNAPAHYGYSKMWLVAEKYKFILVTPNGIENVPDNPQYGNSWNGGACCSPATDAEIDDVGFVEDLIDEIMEDHCIDPKRIFAAGFSNGGFMSNRLACELSDRIAAIAPVASGVALELLDCNPLRPVPIIAFHGTLDPMIPYPKDTLGPYSPYGGGVDNVDAWVKRNGCSDKTKIYYQEGNVTCIAYKGCYKNADVVFCTIEGGGHAWPGAPNLCEYFSIPLEPDGSCKYGATTQDIDASTAIWKFFAKHSMPGWKN